MQKRGREESEQMFRGKEEKDNSRVISRHSQVPTLTSGCSESLKQEADLNRRKKERYTCVMTNGRIPYNMIDIGK